MKKAFTLVELIFVMVVLAIIAGVGTDILRSLFDNYAVTAQIHRLESVANNTADMIATRLEKRVPQTTAIETTGTNYQPLSAINAQSGKLVFFRKAYELERNFISAKKGGAAAPRASGFINDLKTTTTGDNGNFTDEVKFTSIDAADLKLDEYELFFSNDSSLLYENKSNHFDRYYKNSGKSFAYHCANGELKFQAGKFTLTRSDCPASTSDIIRPSMAALIHKFSLSKEIDKIYLDTNKNLYLETCDIKGACKKSLLATGVSTFRFSALGSDPNIASTIVFKLCLVENEGKAEACQSRIVR